jgi:hypothetical protein
VHRTWESLKRHSTQNPAGAGLREADDGTRTHDLLHGKCERPFAPVRVRSLKPPVCRVWVRPSERERTRANAEACHSCHGLRAPNLDSSTFSATRFARVLLAERRQVKEALNAWGRARNARRWRLVSVGRGDEPPHERATARAAARSIWPGTRSRRERVLVEVDRFAASLVVVSLVAVALLDADRALEARAVRLLAIDQLELDTCARTGQPPIDDATLQHGCA